MTKKLAAQILIACATSVLVSGCAPIISGVMNATTDENAVLEKTAKYFYTPKENITIASMEKGALATTYQAKYAGKFYSCSIYYGQVTCTQPGGPNDHQNDVAMKEAASRPAPPAAAEVHSAAPSEQAMTATQAQVRLNALGYTVGTPDGVFGKKSVEKLKAFQQSRGLATTGKLDDVTVAALR